MECGEYNEHSVGQEQREIQMGSERKKRKERRHENEQRQESRKGRRMRKEEVKKGTE
jgi:hypothetical protein